MKMKHLIVIIGILILTNSAIFVQGIPIILSSTGQPEDPPQSLPVIDQRVDIEIDNGWVVTNVSQVFYNPHDLPIQGTYLFAIPESAFILGGNPWKDHQAESDGQPPHKFSVTDYSIM